LAAVLLALCTPLAAAPLRVGLDLDGAPMTFVDAKGVPAGFSVDVMNAIAAEMHFEVVYVAKPWAEMFEDFREGRLDALANIVYTPQRAAAMEFSDPDIVMNAAVFVRKDSVPITSLLDLEHLRIAVKPGGGPHVYLEAHGWAKHIVPTATLRDALRKVAEGQADVTIDARIVGLKNIQDEHLTQLETADVELLDFAQRLHIGLQRGDQTHLTLVNEGLARLHASGTYDRIYEKWIDPLDPRRVKFRQLLPYLVPAGLVLAAISGALFWQRRVALQLARQARQLRDSEERLTLVLESGGHGLWDWNAVTNHVERNQQSAMMIGYTEQEIGATPGGWEEYIHPDDRPLLHAAQVRMRSPTDNSFVVEYRMKAKDGRSHWIYTRGRVLERRPDGTPARVAGTHTDITDRKIAEEERATFQRKMLETQKLESLGILAGGIAHDFNNLLTVILAQSTFARLPGQTDEVTREALGQIETAARRAADLCHQMLTYAGGRTFTLERVDLRALVADLSPLLRHSVGKNAQLRFDLAQSLPAVAAEPTQLRQILLNLVINASEALRPEGGTIRIVTEVRAPSEIDLRTAVHTPARPLAESVCLSVSDDGVGMTAETRAKIFEPFFTTKFTGRGLGLAAVLGIVRAHHGMFCLRSEPGAGATFTAFFPMAPAELTSRAIAPAVRRVATARRGSLLLADDEAAVRNTAAAFLRHQGYTVVTAADGREAVDLFSASPDAFSAVILDTTMPRLGGLEALAEIRAVRRQVPILVMSGFGAEALNHLPTPTRPIFLAKPFTHDDLLSRLAEAIASAA
jgi:PAS domain S-box-containing protein